MEEGLLRCCTLSSHFFPSCSPSTGAAAAMAERRLISAVPFLLLLLVAATSADQISERKALEAFRQAVGLYARLGWNLSDSPCSWKGVACESGNVTVIRLPGVNLIGSVPAGTLGELSSLRTLSLRKNRLSGSIPADLPRSLRNLYLQGNDFSGPIPASFPLLTNLVRLNLADNSLSGSMPSSLNNLTRLRTFYLEGNAFSGKIPDLRFTDLAQFNISYNNLSGSIPQSLRKWGKESFLGLSGLCGSPFPPCPGEVVPSPSPSSEPVVVPSDTGNKKRKLSGGAIAGIVIGCIAAVLILALIVVFLCRKRRDGSKAVSAEAGVEPKPAESEMPMREKPPPRETANGSRSVPPAPVVPSPGTKALVFLGDGGTGGGGAGERRAFDLEDLLRASAEVLGKGTFGTAYKAVLENGVVVAVKRLRDVELREDEFRERIEAVGVMSHPNLVPLRAYYYSADEKLLVYDYMAMGSLSALLHGNRGSGRTPLNWEARSSIALAAARGIEYIHSTGPNVSHGNIRSSNVLLSKSSDARVSDQGLSHLVNPSSLPTRVAGYRAPEVTDARRVSQKADVYSFGVLLLELLTGKAPQQALLNEEGVDLPRWVQSVVREEWTSEVFDLELLRYQNVEEEMVQLLQLAMDCAAQYPDNRPTMSEVVRRIEDICRSTMEPVENDQPQHPTAEGQ